MSVAGCGTHTATILDRNGATVTVAQVLTEVEWNRVLDGTSSARALIQPEGNCCNRLGRIGSWRNRLVIFRDGQYVWDGPITDVTWSLGQVEVTAEDVSVWLDDRVPHQDKTFTNVDLSEIAQWLIEDGYAPDDPGHTVEVIGQAGISGSRSYSNRDRPDRRPSPPARRGRYRLHGDRLEDPASAGDPSRQRRPPVGRRRAAAPAAARSASTATRGRAERAASPGSVTAAGSARPAAAARPVPWPGTATASTAPPGGAGVVIVWLFA
ncbi:hypothetical protein [Streptomyces mirabilis]|uniref:hypothetical protein n=1 Tax=Streptomyces mirabilis TaxID=68239 RepID=UPI0036DD14B2